MLASWTENLERFRLTFYPAPVVCYAVRVVREAILTRVSANSTALNMPTEKPKGYLRLERDENGKVFLSGVPNKVDPDRAKRAAAVARRSIPNGTDSLELLDECRGQ